MSATAKCGAAPTLPLLVPLAPPALQTRCAHGQPPAWRHCRPQLSRRLAVRAAGDREPQQHDEAAQDGEAAAGAAKQIDADDATSSGNSQRPSRRSVVTQGAVAAAAAIGGQYLWLRSAPKAGAAEDVCERVAKAPAALREQLDGPRLLKQQIYYPEWLFGEWRVKETYVGNPVMAGAPLLAVHSMQASGRLVKPGDSVPFVQRFYSTLPDTFENSFRMNVGQMPQDAVIADRAFNVTQAANAHGGYEVVRDAVYDTRDPAIQKLLFTGPAGGAPQLVQLQLGVLKGSYAADTDDDFPASSQNFCAREAYSQEQAGQQSDYEFLTTYTRVSANHVTAKQREVYYPPRDGLAGVVLGREPEAVFEYELDMRRVEPPADATGAVSCVETPKGFTQCM